MKHLCDMSIINHIMERPRSQDFTLGATEDVRVHFFLEKVDDFF